METPDRCPECNSAEIAPIERYSSLHQTIRTVVCQACHWSADPRIGRPPADRSKNVGLRLRLGSTAQTAAEDPPEEEPTASEG
jgi:hypothetical protein